MNNITLWAHIILFSHVLGNLVIILGVFKFVRKKYTKQKHLIVQFIFEHDEMYKSFCQQKKKEVHRSRLQLT